MCILYYFKETFVMTEFKAVIWIRCYSSCKCISIIIAMGSAFSYLKLVVILKKNFIFHIIEIYPQKHK